MSVTVGTAICRFDNAAISKDAAGYDLHMLRCPDAPPHMREAARQRIARRLQAAIDEVQARDALRIAAFVGLDIDNQRKRLHAAMAALDAANGTSSVTS